MLRFIIIRFLFLQQPAQRHRAGDEQKIGCRDHQDHRTEEPSHSCHRVVDRHRGIVCIDQQCSSQQREDPVRLRRLLSHTLAPQHLYRTGTQDRDKHPQHDQKKDPDEQNDRVKENTQIH